MMTVPMGLNFFHFIKLAAGVAAKVVISSNDVVLLIYFGGRMVKKLVKALEKDSNTDFVKFIRNNLNPKILTGINYPWSLGSDPSTLNDLKKREWSSFTINRVFERCAERFNELAGRPINSTEAYLLAKEVAGFVEGLRRR